MTSRQMLAAASALLLVPVMLVAQENREFLAKDPPQDQPRVAIIQYESGRIVVVREVNGELQALDPAGTSLDVLQRYLDAASPRPAAQELPADPEPPQADHREAPEAGGQASEGYPLFYNPYWYSDREFINTNEAGDASREGRALERLEQRAAEARQQVRARRARAGVTGLTNMSGRVLPLTAAEQDQYERLEAVARGGSDAYGGTDPAISFYSLGFGLEEYRQQELAARKELALLSYDALMRDGLRFFHNRQYGQAARSFIGAAQKDQGDAASRLHAAQALMANGLHREAMVHVRRAFELMPVLLQRPLNHRASYTHPDDFDAHLAALRDYVEGHPGDLDALVLLAYERFFSSDPADARQIMAEVKYRAAGDPFARKLVAAAEPVLGRL